MHGIVYGGYQGVWESTQIKQVVELIVLILIKSALMVAPSGCDASRAFLYSG
jgi:hypothetical protein